MDQEKRMGLSARFQNTKKRLVDFLVPAYHRANAVSGGRLALIQAAASQYQLSNSHVAAASIAFYAFFSLFPLLAVLVSALGYLVNEEEVVSLLIQALRPLLPFSNALVSQNVERLASSRGTFGLVGTVGLIWSASNLFAILSHYINVAWEKTRVRSLFYRRIVGVGIVIGLVGVLVLTSLVVAILDLVVQFSIPRLGFVTLPEDATWATVFTILQPLLLFIILFLVYRWLPNTPVKPKEALWAALVVTLLWEVTAMLFGAYLRSGITNYDLIYGSLGAFVTMMIWFYINSAIVLFGAHLSAAIAQRDIHRKGLVEDSIEQLPAKPTVPPSLGEPN